MKRKLESRESCDTLHESELRCSDIIIDSDDFCDTEKLRSGLLTSRLRPCSVPRARLTRYYHMRLDNYANLAKFEGIAEWLKPFLHAHQQLGWAETWLCSIFRHLPSDLLRCIHTASVAVVVLSFNRQLVIKENDSSVYRSEDDLFPIEDEPWLYQGLGLSDYELETYHHADFGIIR
jgi:hypothetical protein